MAFALKNVYVLIAYAELEKAARMAKGGIGENEGGGMRAEVGRVCMRR